MKLNRSAYFLLMAAGLFFGKTSYASGQSPFDPSRASEASLIREHVEVFTDRSIYTVNESIRFRADYSVEGLGEGKQWSTVLYVELVTSSGMAVAHGKFSLSSGKSSGDLIIPASALTGNYFLKCYTRWMRNSGPETYSYTPLKLINPFNSEVTSHSNGVAEVQKGSRREYTGGLIECLTTSISYNQGEEVLLRLAGPVNTHLQRFHCCVTIVPAGGIDTLHGQQVFNRAAMNPEDYRVNFLPEPIGPSLSGTVVQAGQEVRPVTLTKVHFTLLGEKPDYFTTITDAHGRFVVSTPDLTGIQELFVTPHPAEGLQAEVRIDQDFDVGSLPVPVEEFSLSPVEREVARQMAIQMQLSTAFQRPVQTKSETVEEDPVGSFYGTPVHSIEMDDYVKLPTLEEVFINLVPDVYVVKRESRSSLKVQSDNSSIGIYEPLLLIDHIPVFDQHAVMSISPAKVSRIDVINEVYIKGNISYGGVISIHSRKGDMAGIDLPIGSYFFDFQSLQPTPQKMVKAFGDRGRVPDTRNTILWLDDVLLERGKIREIPFQAPSRPGEYLILVRALVVPGEVTSATTHFRVE
ncbi:MAG: hypothetical protein KAR19_01770 [Bacteroidales bacterium]|nr:hypothetical protein [Bacteroidales bacterium]